MITTDPGTATAVFGALADVASAGGTESLSLSDHGGLRGAWAIVLEQAGDLPEVGGATDLVSLAAAVRDPDVRLLCVRLAAVMAFDDGRVDEAKLRRVLAVADALDVHADFVTAVHELLAGDVAWVAADQIRHNVDTIPGVPYEPEHPYAVFLPYAEAPNPALAARYDALEGHPAGSLGRAFFDHYRRNGFAFPGRPEAVAEAWATYHDTLHVLSGYSTSAQGEILVAAFTVGQLRGNSDPMESHILPTILIYHLGIDINKGLNAGDRQRMAADPEWTKTYAGTIHLGLDPAKLFVAWDRGTRMTTDVYDPEWDFFAHADRRVEELRAEYSIPALDPADAALDDDAVSADPMRQAGMAEPPVPGSTS
jgi:hypothetical protein